MPEISIIVPVYKVEKYLDQCVSSLREQTIQDIEIILVDDGSPDSCPALCNAYAEQDSRIKVIHKENGGVCSARNAGLDAASGDYIAFVDSDDYIDNCMYEKMLEKAVQNNCDVVMCDCLKEFADHSKLYTHEIRSGFYDRRHLEQEYFPHLLMMENVEYPPTISNWLLMFRRELVASVRYLTGVRYSEDLLFGAQLMYQAGSFFYMKGEAYYHYRMNPQSATHKFVSDKWSDYQKLYAGIKDVFESSEIYDFKHQIDLCLLFFLYNSVGDILNTEIMAAEEKKTLILEILNDTAVRELFARLKIGQLPIGRKQQLITLLYKYKLGVNFLIRHYS